MTDAERIKKIKKMFLNQAYKLNIGHLPSAFSAMEILYVLYNKIANITKDNMTDLVRDRVIISKEHCRFAQVAVLYEKGLLDDDVWNTYMQDGGYAGHDLYNLVSGQKLAAIDVASGSLGHGLGVGTGLALGCPKNHVYVLVGDGELQEGSCWDALMFIGYRQIKNITVIVDRNNQQIDDKTQKIINSSDIAPDAIKILGFDVLECDGHSVEELEKALNTKTTKPKCLIANTIKGRELMPMLDKYGFALFHWVRLDEEDFKHALLEVENGSSGRY